MSPKFQKSKEQKKARNIKWLVICIVIISIFLSSTSIFENLLEPLQKIAGLREDEKDIADTSDIEDVNQLIKVSETESHQDEILSFEEQEQQRIESLRQDMKERGDWIYRTNRGYTALDYTSETLLLPSEDLGQKYIDRLTFICDSPTYWLLWFDLLSDDKGYTQMWTGPGGTMTLAYQSTYKILDPFDEEERYIKDVVERHPPDILVIALGINGISFMDEGYFKEEYAALIRTVREKSPDTLIICQSIFPITEDYIYYGDITNEMVTKANTWILDVAEEMTCSYSDVFTVFYDESGVLQEHLFQKDGLHPNKEGLELVIQYIRTHGLQE